MMIMAKSQSLILALILGAPNCNFTFTRELIMEEHDENVNAKSFHSNGIYLYLTQWKEGSTSFFPTQGTSCAIRCIRDTK